jgi:hypothetical protein
VGIVGVEHDVTPEAGSARMIAACSSATSATLRMNSWCSRCALFDDGNRRLRDDRKLRRLAGMISSELDRRRGMLRAEPEQRQRQADRVVEIAFGREHARRT